MTKHLQEYSKLDNFQEVYSAVRKHIALHHDKLTKADRRVLDLILQYTVMNGAAYLTCEEIMKDTERSKATVQRAIRKLVTLRIIEKVHTFDPEVGGLGANRYTIFPSEEQS
ncbi:helix-turn-helix domain-containing protein [Sporosarcina koreensis]|uniref:Helix-turn-helix domain-containing protein n=1 Tax=Sporosarcina koreensis TaxID=334735 RepID=A0ABW0U194_9BACL